MKANSKPEISPEEEINPEEGALVLADGEIFEGDVYAGAGEKNIFSGEVVFNTVHTGYQEVITDPSYAGQIITFTYPHIGNYGAISKDSESRRPFCRGVIVRDISHTHSNWQAEEGLLSYLVNQSVPLISGIDTRRLTKHIRDAGAMPGAFGVASEKELLKAAQAEPGTDGVNLVNEVTTAEPYFYPPVENAEGKTAKYGDKNGNLKKGNLKKDSAENTEAGRKEFSVVAIDFGIKKSILEQLSEFCQIEVVPADTTAADILARNPDGVFLSNGPGDPDCVSDAAVFELLGNVAIFGICLGFQILAQAMGAQTYKLPFGHHGGNHPVMNYQTGKVEITAQNHNFAVDGNSFSEDFLADSGLEITHINLNDQTLEGIYSKELKAMGIQYHPEAGPGPHDSRYLFSRFAELMEK